MQLLLSYGLGDMITLPSERVVILYFAECIFHEVLGSKVKGSGQKLYQMFLFNLSFYLLIN